MSVPSLEALLDAGCHFGHLTSRWNPKMKKYIFMQKNGIHLIDVKQTQSHLEKACDELTKIAKTGEQVLFVGTKKQAQDIIKTEADRSGNYYIAHRWLGGLLTNFSTVKKSVRKWKSLEKKAIDGTYEKINKRERLEIDREKAKMSLVLAGIADMKRLPGALVIVDSVKEEIAIKEAIKLGIPVFAMLDTNSDPDIVDYGIPANDDASKSIAIIMKTMADAYNEGAANVKAKKDDSETKTDDAKKVVRKRTIKKELTDNTEE